MLTINECSVEQSKKLQKILEDEDLLLEEIKGKDLAHVKRLALYRWGLENRRRLFKTKKTGDEYSPICIFFSSCEGCLFFRADDDCPLADLDYNVISSLDNWFSEDPFADFCGACDKMYFAIKEGLKNV